jgi:hypothetical protein
VEVQYQFDTYSKTFLTNQTWTTNFIDSNFFFIILFYSSIKLLFYQWAFPTR